MDKLAVGIVARYIGEHFDVSGREVGLFISWKSKVLQNYKYLISSTLGDGRYYELTYNGDKKEWYLDVYEKAENIVIKEI